ncbi:hypothetical protein [Bradyrhizobium diversitatis]|uniref:hypothetical protein n=1 Tax=Bradyrhizobium diversitatis TaxID=2755406 RepID=UPI001AEE1126|nr:hypothetical protein [Bradyrhizobium diversitatis]
MSGRGNRFLRRFALAKRRACGSDWKESSDFKHGGSSGERNDAPIGCRRQVPVRRSVVSLADIRPKVVARSNNFQMMMARLAKPGCTFEHDQLDLMIIDIVMPHCPPEHRGGGIASAARRG